MTDKETQLALAKRIKEARKLSGLSQAHVAKFLGIHRPSVSEIEAGNRRVSAEEITKLAEIFDVSVSWLLGEGEDKISPEDPRIQLAARELNKLRSDDLDRLLRLMAAMRDEPAHREEGD
ncbi:MAG: helix-turn-helix domain-containing protein [Rhodospirillales bacterium]|jgi:transcriptional regulator with XRE-family HTH domain|nr:helix-turn-helix domain-containing protein [Rhodospirillales bacterium]